MSESGGYAGWLSLRELDHAAGLPKGSAFRAFKQLLPELVEERDFVVVDHARHAALGAALHAAQRVYRSSVNPLLLSPATAAALGATLQAMRAAQQSQQ